MFSLVFGFLVLVVVLAAAVGGAATRYERVGPRAHRSAAGAVAVLAMVLAASVLLALFVVTVWETAGTPWRMLGAVATISVLAALAAVRFVDHMLALGSYQVAARALVQDVQGVRDLPWRQIGAAMSGALGEVRDQTKDRSVRYVAAGRDLIGRAGS